MVCCENPDMSKGNCSASRQKLYSFIPVVVMALAIICAAAMLKGGFENFRIGDRFVSVRGLATKDVDADLAVWAIRHAVTSNVLQDARTQLEKDSQLIRDFVVEQGLGAESVSVQSIDSQDLMAQQYRPDNIQNGRYVLTETLVLRSDNIEKVAAMTQNLNQLLAKGVVLSNTSNPTYLFTKLNDVKPMMIAEATQNARAGAEQFAKDSGQRVGKIRSASQGYFEIQPRDPVMDIPESAQRQKIVRVVTSIDYFLE
jgi:uncharacterized protein